MPEIDAKGSKLFAIAPEKMEICQEFKAASGLRFDLLSDSNNKVANMVWYTNCLKQRRR